MPLWCRILLVSACLTLSSLSAQAAPGCTTVMLQSRLDNFIERPQGVLNQYPQGGIDLAGTIRSFAMTNDDALKAIGKLISGANMAQRAAIGNGLAGAYKVCQDQSPRVSERVAKFVSQLYEIDVLRAYRTYLAADEVPAPAPSDDKDEEPSHRGITTDRMLDPAALPLGNPLAPIGSPPAMVR